MLFCLGKIKVRTDILKLMARQQFRVTCKAALFDSEKAKVLLVEYRKNEYGLPGGHLELGETPEEATRRELAEELGIDYQEYLVLKDSWLHPNGKLIIGFVGHLDDTIRLSIDPVEIRSAKWTKISDIRTNKVHTYGYKEFILENA